MAVYFVTGKLGGGKSLAAVGRIRDYLRQGRRVATNLDLYLEHLCKAKSKETVMRVPDKPRLEDFQLMGTGDGKPLDDYDESRFGLLVLDELGSWMNSRTWNDKSRLAVLDWFLHARKYHWDVMLIVQDISIIDAQLRESLCEHLVICRRVDRLALPYVGSLFKLLTGKKMPLPRVHVASVFYGQSASAMRVDRWWYRGSDLYAGYRTGQVFSNDELFTEGGAVDLRASYTMLSAWHLKGRYPQPRRVWFRVEWLALALLVPVILVAATVTGRSPVTVARCWNILSRRPRSSQSSEPVAAVAGASPL